MSELITRGYNNITVYDCQNYIEQVKSCISCTLFTTLGNAGADITTLKRYEA